jgi:protein-S-isoprenylcysteine O-methyltransferase Ste14
MGRKINNWLIKKYSRGNKHLNKRGKVLSIMLGAAWEWGVLPAFFVFLTKWLDTKIRLPIIMPATVKIPLVIAFFIAGIFFTCRSIYDITKLGEGTFIPATEPPRKLVTSGVYRICRNPMYLGYIFLFMAIGLIYSSPFILFVIVPGIVLFLFCYSKLVEERVLTEHFGKQYLQYRQSTPFLIPRWINRRESRHPEKESSASSGGIDFNQAKSKS